MTQTITQRKVKVLGTVQRINPETGELEDYQLTQVEDRDFNFHKVWMKSFIQTLDIVGNQKTRFAFWLIDNLTKDNALMFTYRQMSEKSGISLGTVRDTMRLLMDADFMRPINRGCYIVNPNITFKGTHNARLNVLNQYGELQQVTMSKAEKLCNLQKAISELQQRANKLIAEIQQENNKNKDIA